MDECAECERVGYPCPDHATCPYVARELACPYAAEDGLIWCKACARSDPRACFKHGEPIRSDGICWKCNIERFDD